MRCGFFVSKYEDFLFHLWSKFRGITKKALEVKLQMFFCWHVFAISTSNSYNGY